MSFRGVDPIFSDRLFINATNFCLRRFPCESDLLWRPPQRALTKIEREFIVLLSAKLLNQTGIPTAGSVSVLTFKKQFLPECGKVLPGKV